MNNTTNEQRSALDRDPARENFRKLTPEDAVTAVRRLASQGYGDETIASATGLSVEQVRRWIGPRDSR